MITNVMERLIDFTRTSGGGYFGPDGLFRFTPASRNLLLYTQELNNGAWVKQSGSVTANAVAAPDGTTTADVFTPTAQFGNVRNPNFPTITSGTITVSVWLRVASGTRNIHIRATTNAEYYAMLVTVTETWTRFSATFTHDGTTAFNEFAVQDRNASGFVPIEIWGAQLELASAATEYTRNVGGLYPPRFDYDPVTLAPRGLLIEEQRTNLLLRSEEFDNASWTKTNGGVASAPVVTANFGTSPDGTVDADRVQFALNGGSTTSDLSDLLQAATVPAGSVTISVWLKSNTGGTQTIAVLGEGVQRATWAATAAWQRFTVTYTSTGGAGSFGFRLRGTVTPDTADILIWGAQLEAGAFPTSHIPTQASQVTRASDNAVITGANFSRWYNQTEGTFVVEADSVVPTSTAVFHSVGATDGTSGNALAMFVYNSRWGASSTVGGVSQADLQVNGSHVSNVPAKSAFAYKVNDIAFSVNGSEALTDMAGSVPAVDRLAIGALGQAFGGFLNGHIRRIRYYPTRLSDTQLQALTA